VAPYGSEPGAIADVDGAEVAAWFGHPRNYRLSVSSGMALEAVEVIATRHQFHPVRDYLEGLTWDGTPRLERMFSDYFGAVHDEYTAAVGRNWLTSAVARVRDPGCKVDFMVILEGEQGRGKSTAVRVLCGAQWFAEMLESPQNKDFYQILTGRWIIEIPELQAFNKADRNKIKAAVSAQEDTYRPSYGRYARQFPRQCIFVGTTNDDTYLKDETGARRFLPIRCSDIDLKALAAVRDQLWAEADARFAAGEPYWEFPESAVAEQDARFDADAWEEPIIRWLDGHGRAEEYPEHYPPVRDDRPVQETTIADVMLHALKVETAKHSRPDQMRVGAILRRLQWRREQKRRDGRRIYVFVRPGEP
jgi:predicted P-loop ATPase